MVVNYSRGRRGEGDSAVLRGTILTPVKIRSQVLAGNAQLPHLGMKSRTQQAQPRRSAVRTADNAFGLSQRLQNVFALGLLERKGCASVRCSGGLQVRQVSLPRARPS